MAYDDYEHLLVEVADGVATVRMNRPEKLNAFNATMGLELLRLPDALRADPEVEANVSHYSALPSVREAMVRKQRAIAGKGLAVLAGRDIGTVVLPNAPLKFYLEASEDARAERRGKQSGEWGQAQADADARRDIHRRDVIDSTRGVAPLRAAPDAVVIDTTALSLEEVLKLALENVQCASG